MDNNSLGRAGRSGYTTECVCRRLPLQSPWAKLTRRTLLAVALAAAGSSGTDAVARKMASLVERDLGQPVNVVNRTGGKGVVGHAATAGATAVGHTIGKITVRHHLQVSECQTRMKVQQAQNQQLHIDQRQRGRAAP